MLQAQCREHICELGTVQALELCLLIRQQEQIISEPEGVPLMLHCEQDGGQERGKEATKSAS